MYLYSGKITANGTADQLKRLKKIVEQRLVLWESEQDRQALSKPTKRQRGNKKINKIQKGEHINRDLGNPKYHYVFLKTCTPQNWKI